MTLRVLVVDDQPNNFDGFIESAVNLGIAASDIEIVKTGLDALRRLEKEKYDVLILDIALPFREGDEVEPTGGIDVLEDMFSRNEVKRPSYIVCITAHESLDQRVLDYLDEHVIYLVRAGAANQAWVSSLRNFLTNVLLIGQQEEPITYQSDICVITALRDPEFKALKAIKWNWGPPQILDRTTSYMPGNFIVDGESYDIFAASCARMGMVESALVASRLISKFRPRLLVMTGVCAGVQNHTNIGDIVCGSPCWNHQSVKRIVDSQGKTEILPNLDFIDLDEKLRPLIEEFSDNTTIFSRIRSDWPGDAPDTALRFLPGPMASGSTIMADDSFEGLRKSQHKELLAVEMEAYGVFSAARATGRARPLVLAAKSVCDHGNYLKNDRFQKYAAYTSAAACAAFCEHYAPTIRGLTAD